MTQSHSSQSENSAGTDNRPAMQRNDVHPATLDSGYDDEIDLFQLFEALWRQKALIAGVTLICLAGALAYLFVATPMYEVTALVRPGITAYDEDKPLYGWSVTDIQSWIKDGHYRPFLQAVWTKTGNPPKIAARAGRNVKFVTLSLRTPDPQYGKKALQSVLQRWVQYYAGDGADAQIQATSQSFENQINSFKDQLKSLQEVESQKLESRVAERTREMQVITQEIQLVKNSKDVAQAGMDALNSRMEKTLENTDELSRLRDALIRKGQAENLSFLLYSNIIQQNIFHVSDLQKQIADAQNTMLRYDRKIDGLKKQIADIQDGIRQLKQEKEVTLAQRQQLVQRQIELIQAREKSLAPIEVIAPPIASDKPVSPKRLLTLVLAIFVGGMLGVMAAWIRSAWQARTERTS